MKKKIKENKFVFLFFFIILIIGIFTYKDYGMSNDEIEEARHTVLYYGEYVKLFNKENDQSLKDFYNKFYSWENYKPTMKTYLYKYYGTASQMVPIIIESISGYKISVSNYFYMRHLYTFLVYFIALIYFYLILYKYILKDKKHALLGTFFLYLSPRIYGDAFYNIKDLMFMSLTIINLYYIFEFIKTDKKSSLIKLAIISAFSINCRIVGLLFICLGIIFNVIFNKKNIKKSLLQSLTLLIITYLIYLLITPSSWEKPFMFIMDSVKYFYNYEDPISKIKLYNFYNGHWIYSGKLPWHYIPVWIVITTPIIYIVFFIVGMYKNIRNYKNNDLCIWYLNMILIIILVFVFIFRPVLYGGWRHLYFLYPIIIINAIIGFKYIKEKLSKNTKKILYIIVLINSLAIGAWMIKNHPYQSEYFDFIGRNYYVKNFEKNYYRMSNVEAIRYILKIDNRNNITIYAPFNKGCSKLLESDDYSRVYVNDYIENSDYIIDTTIDGSKKPKNYKSIKVKKMDGVRLYTIYKKRGNKYENK